MVLIAEFVMSEPEEAEQDLAEAEDPGQMPELPLLLLA